MFKFTSFFWLTIFIVLARQVSYAQATKDANNSIGPYEGIITDSSTTKVVLYNRSKQWVVRTFKSYDNNINLDDKGGNVVATTPIINLEKRSIGTVYSTSNKCSFKLTILVKDGKIKYVFDDFSHQYVMASSYSPVVYDGPFEKSRLFKLKHKKMQPELDELMKGYVESLRKAIKNNSKEADW